MKNENEAILIEKVKSLTALLQIARPYPVLQAIGTNELNPAIMDTKPIIEKILELIKKY